MFPVSLPDFQEHQFLVNDDIHVAVPYVLRERSTRPSDGDDERLDGNDDALEDLELICFLNDAKCHRRTSNPLINLLTWTVRCV